MCRAQDVLSFENIHNEPHKLLKFMFTCKSAVLCTIEIMKQLRFYLFEQYGLWNWEVQSKTLSNCYFIFFLGKGVVTLLLKRGIIYQ